MLVSLTVLAGALPFLFPRGGFIGLPLLNFVQAGLLFFIGYRWAEQAGANPWRTGAGVVALGTGMAVISVVFGG